jgi:hypothetical protein
MVVRRGLTWNCFFSLILYFPSLSFLDCMLTMQKFIPAFQIFFLIQSLFSYLKLFLFTLIVFYWILFLISPPWSFDFFNLFSNLVLILLISICFVLNYFLDWFVFFFNSTPRNLFLFNFYVKFGSNSFNSNFLNHFLNGFVLYNSILEHLISFDFSVDI